MSDPQLYLSLMLQAGDRIAQLEDERDIFKRTLDKRDKRIAELEAFVTAYDKWLTDDCALPYEPLDIARNALEKGE